MSPQHEALIDRLPEELIVHVLSYLDEAPPPSETRLREEPSLLLTTSGDHLLKDVSLVSKRWRRLVLPMLFKHTRLRIDGALRPAWKQCSTCNEHILTAILSGSSYMTKADNIDQYHLDMVRDAANRIPTSNPPSQDFSSRSGTSSMFEIVLTWLPRFYHPLKDLLDFLKLHDLTTKIESFLLVTDQMLHDKLDRFPHRAAPDRDWRYRCAAAFWQHFMSVLDVPRIVILAPPNDLACLTNCAIDTFGDWAFGDMEFQLLELSLDSSTTQQPSPLLGKPVEYGGLNFTPRRHPGIAGSSILHLRPWHSITINEGCFLKAYGTYEYFERGPPSLIYSLKDCLTPRPTYTASASRTTPPPLADLRKLAYIGIFPFANHLDFRELLPQLEELDLQLAPRQSSNILMSSERVGKAELEDCWSELVSVYQNLASQLSTARISKENMPRLKRLVCRDYRPALDEELDEVFMPLCLPVWVEYHQGEFTRTMMSAEEVYGPRAN